MAGGERLDAENLSIVKAWIEAIGRRVAELRHAKDWKQETLATEAKVQRSQITDIENGSRMYRIDTLLKVLLALHVDLWTSFGGNHRLAPKRRMDHEMMHVILEDLLSPEDPEASPVTQATLRAFHAQYVRRR